MGDFLNELLGLNLVPSSKQEEDDQEIQIDTMKEKKKPQTRFSFYNPFALVKSQPQEDVEPQPQQQVTEEEQFEDAVSTTNDDPDEPEERLNIDISSDQNDSLNDSTAELESIERRQDQITPEHATTSSLSGNEETKDESSTLPSNSISSQPEQQPVLSTSTWLERRSPFFHTASSMTSSVASSSRPPSSLAGDLNEHSTETAVDQQDSEEDSETQYDTAEELSTTGGNTSGPLHSPSLGEPDHPEPSSTDLDSLTNYAKALLMEEEEQQVDAQGDDDDMAKDPPATTLADQHVSNQSKRDDMTPARSNKSMAVRPEAPPVPTIDRTPQSQPKVDEETPTNSSDPEIPSSPNALSPTELRKSPPPTTSSLARASPTHEEVFNTPKSLREITASPLNHSSLTKPQALLFDQDIPKLPDPTVEQDIEIADEYSLEQQQPPLDSPPVSPISVRPESPAQASKDGVSVDDVSAETETINNTSRNQTEKPCPSEFSLLMQEELDLSREVKEQQQQHSITETGQALDLMMNGDNKNDTGIMEHDVYTGPDDNLLDLSTQIAADFAAILHDQEAAEIASEFAAILGPTNSAEPVFPLLKCNGQDANEEEFADSPVFQLLDDEIGSEFQAILSDDASKSNQVESEQPVLENGASHSFKSYVVKEDDGEADERLAVGPLEGPKSDPATEMEGDATDLHTLAAPTAKDPPESSGSSVIPMETKALDPPGDESSQLKDEPLTRLAPQSSQEHDDVTRLPNSIIPSSADTISSALTEEFPKVFQDTATTAAPSPSRKRPSSMNIEFQSRQRARRRASSSMELYLAASSESSVTSNHSAGSSSRHARRPSLELIPKGIASEQSHKIGDAFGAATPLKAKALQKRRESELLLLQELGIATEGTNIMEETKQYRQIMDNEHLSEDQRKQELLKLLELGKAKANSVMMETRRKSFQSDDIPSLDEIKKSRSALSTKHAEHPSPTQRLCLSESDAQRTTLSVDVSSAPLFPQIITEVSLEQDVVEDESSSRQPLPIHLLALDELTLSNGCSVNSDSAVDYDLLVDLTNHRTGTVQRRRQTSPSIRVGNPVFFADQCELIELPEEHQMAQDPLGEQLCQLVVEYSDSNKTYPSLSSLFEAELEALTTKHSSKFPLVRLTSREHAQSSTKPPFQLIDTIILKDGKEQLTTSGNQKLSVDTGGVELEADQVDNHDDPSMMLPLVSLSSVASRSTPTREFEQLKNDDTIFQEGSKTVIKELSVDTTTEFALVNLTSVSPKQMGTEQPSPSMELLQIPEERDFSQHEEVSNSDPKNQIDPNHHPPLVSLGSVTPRSTPTRTFALLQDEETTFSEGVNAVVDAATEAHVKSVQTVEIEDSEQQQEHHVDLVMLRSSRPRTIKSKAMPILDDPITMTMSSYHVAKSQDISPVWKQSSSMSEDTNDDEQDHQLDEEVVGFYRSVSVKDLRRSMSQLRITYPDTEDEDDDNDDVLVIEPDTQEVEEESHELRLVPSPSELSELSSSQSVTTTSMLNRSSIWKTRVSKIRERRLQDSLRSLSAHQSGHVPPPPTTPFNSPTLVSKPKLQLAPGGPPALGRDEDEDALAKVATKSKLPSRSRSMSDGEYSEFDELHHDEDDLWEASATPSGTTTRSTTPFSSEVMAATSASSLVPNETTTTQENNNNNNPAVLFETAGDFSAFHQAVQSFQDQPHGADRMERLNERRRASMEQEQSSEQQQVTRSSGQKPPRPSPLNLPSLTPPPPPLLSATPPPILTSSLTMSTPSSAPLPNMTVHLFDTPTVQKWKQRASFAREKSQKRLSATPRPNEVTTTTLPTIPGATVVTTGAMLVASESKSLPISTNIGMEVPLMVKAATQQLQQQCVTDDNAEWNVILSLQTSVTTDCYEGQRTVTVTVTGTPAQVQYE